MPLYTVDLKNVHVEILSQVAVQFGDYLVARGNSMRQDSLRERYEKTTLAVKIRIKTLLNL